MFIGCLALLLDLTVWFAMVGGVLGLVGGALALLVTRSRLRRAALYVNGAAFLVAAVIYAWILLYAVTN